MISKFGGDFKSTIEFSLKLLNELRLRQGRGVSGSTLYVVSSFHATVWGSDDELCSKTWVLGSDSMQ